jgi:hypothetical protein
VIGVPKVYFDDEHFRESLRIALSDLCAAFPPSTQYRPRRPYMYDTLGCADGRAASLSVYINVRDTRIEPPYNIDIQTPGAKLVAVAYFSASTKQVTIISEHPQ